MYLRMCPGIIPCSREITFLLIYSLLAVLTMIGPGSSIGFSSISLPALSSNTSSITLTESEEPLFASLPIISQIFGCLGSLITMHYGRRIAIVTGNLVCALGWITVTFSYSTVPLFIGRILTGLSVGLCAAPSTVYLGEISPARWRSAITCCTSLFINVGIVLVYLFGFIMRDNWKDVAALCILFPAVSAIATFIFLPESPSWLLTKGRTEDARVSLFRIRGLKQETSKFQTEFSDLVNYIKNNSRNNEHEEESENMERILLGSQLRKKWKDTLDMFRLPEVWKPLVILSSFFFFQQFSGCYVLMTYAVDIVVNSGITVDPFLITVCLGIIQVLGGIANMLCSTRIGRRKTSIGSGIGMSVSLALLAINGYLSGVLYNAPSVPLVCILLFVASGAIGFIVLPWAMIGELYPSRYVNIFGPLTTCLAGIFNFIIIQVYPAMVQYNMDFTIQFYCIVAVIATIFVTLFLPESLGKNKSEIEEKFRTTCFAW